MIPTSCHVLDPSDMSALDIIIDVVNSSGMSGWKTIVLVRNVLVNSVGNKDRKKDKALKNTNFPNTRVHGQNPAGPVRGSKGNFGSLLPLGLGFTLTTQQRQFTRPICWSLSHFFATSLSRSQLQLLFRMN